MTSTKSTMRQFSRPIVFVILTFLAHGLLFIIWKWRTKYTNHLTNDNTDLWLDLKLCYSHWLNFDWYNLLQFLSYHCLIVHLNKYETAPYFFLLSQNLICDCLSISVILPEFTWSEPKIVLNIKTEIKWPLVDL